MTFAVFLSHLAEQLNSAVFVLLLILGVAFWVVYKIARLIAVWEDRDNELTKLRADWNRDIPPLKAKVEAQTEEMAKFRADWNRDIPPLQAKMNLVFQKLYADTSVKAESPTRLTEVGREIVRVLDAESVTETHLGKLRELVDQNAPETAYDLQQECFAVVDRHMPDLLDDAQLRIAKDQALKHGIPLDNALAVFGVLLRDRLAAEKGISLGDPDKTAAE